ncbi:uncharacterized protein LOC126973781 [Leptidea sinapis]|uniref:uncharacterized protein LOC126973781 n=1 Tax=Leptidea sinapis TaxID=189913 RepID=UPI0021C42979|nr:uncharacterized protein LOC126973781 [Leptidea sinapis]
MQSKTLEGREQQIKFKKQLQDDQLNNNTKPDSVSIENAEEMEKKEKEIFRKKKRNMEIAQYNKLMFQCQTEQKKKEKAEDVKFELEEAMNNKLLLQMEEHNENEARLAAWKEMVDHAEEGRKIREEKRQRDIEEDKKIATWQLNNERIAKRINQINKQLTQKSETDQYKKVFKTIDTLNQDEKKRYEEFINKGIERLQKSTEIEENLKKYSELQKVTAIKKKIESEPKFDKPYEQNKNVCDRQCIILCKSEMEKKLHKNKTFINKDLIQTHPKSLRSKNQLLEAYKKRKEEPSPWNGLEASHCHFTHYADELLRDCRYKYFPQKVINDYNRSHNLNNKTGLSTQDRK